MRCVYPLLVLLLLACKKKKHEEFFVNRQLQAITAPTVLLHDLGTGMLNCKKEIREINRYSWGIDSNIYTFSYYPDSRKIRSVYFRPNAHPQSCSFLRLDFFYKKERIDRVEKSEPTSGCAINVRSYQFTYFPMGMVKSIVETNFTDYVDERYFAYDEKGRVSKLFHSYRRQNETPYRYSETSFRYDHLGNVKEATIQPLYSDKVEEVYTFTYDSVANPFKGHYMFHNLSLLGWAESAGPLFLSENNVRHTTKHILSNGAVQQFPYHLRYDNHLLQRFFYFDQFGSTITYQ